MATDSRFEAVTTERASGNYCSLRSEKIGVDTLSKSLEAAFFIRLKWLPVSHRFHLRQRMLALTHQQKMKNTPRPNVSTAYRNSEDHLHLHTYTGSSRWDLIQRGYLGNCEPIPGPIEHTLTALRNAHKLDSLLTNEWELLTLDDSDYLRVRLEALSKAHRTRAKVDVATATGLHTVESQQVEETTGAADDPDGDAKGCISWNPDALYSLYALRVSSGDGEFIFAAARRDLEVLELQMLRIASIFIFKQEYDSLPTSPWKRNNDKNYSEREADSIVTPIDRLQVLRDVYDCEVAFLQTKVQLVEILLENVVRDADDKWFSATSVGEFQALQHALLESTLVMWSLIIKLELPGRPVRCLERTAGDLLVGCGWQLILYPQLLSDVCRTLHEQPNGSSTLVESLTKAIELENWRQTLAKNVYEANLLEQAEDLEPRRRSLLQLQRRYVAYLRVSVKYHDAVGADVFEFAASYPYVCLANSFTPTTSDESSTISMDLNTVRTKYAKEIADKMTEELRTSCFPYWKRLESLKQQLLEHSKLIKWLMVKLHQLKVDLNIHERPKVEQLLLTPPATKLVRAGELSWFGEVRPREREREWQAFEDAVSKYESTDCAYIDGVTHLLELHRVFLDENSRAALRLAEDNDKPSLSLQYTAESEALVALEDVWERFHLLEWDSSVNTAPVVGGGNLDLKKRLLLDMGISPTSSVKDSSYALRSLHMGATAPLTHFWTSGLLILPPSSIIEEMLVYLEFHEKIETQWEKVKDEERIRREAFAADHAYRLYFEGEALRKQLHVLEANRELDRQVMRCELNAEYEEKLHAMHAELLDKQQKFAEYRATMQRELQTVIQGAHSQFVDQLLDYSGTLPATTKHSVSHLLRGQQDVVRIRSENAAMKQALVKVQALGDMQQQTHTAAKEREVLLSQRYATAESLLRHEVEQLQIYVKQLEQNMTKLSQEKTYYQVKWTTVHKEMEGTTQRRREEKVRGLAATHNRTDCDDLPAISPRVCAVPDGKSDTESSMDTSTGRTQICTLFKAKYSEQHVGKEIPSG
ncbi:hypothetical protein PInf_017409 [Phytophthora infestans]|nr:hypothetical protein PInf_017409 [Phytophthora infestans]